MMCRGQGYDTASTMSGIHGGVQQTLKNINPKALFVPCEHHKLNLAGVHAVEPLQLSDRFFAVLERLRDVEAAIFELLPLPPLALPPLPLPSLPLPPLDDVIFS